jgi:hypothetical protein
MRYRVPVVYVAFPVMAAFIIPSPLHAYQFILLTAVAILLVFSARHILRSRFRKSVQKVIGESEKRQVRIEKPQIRKPPGKIDPLHHFSGSGIPRNSEVLRLLRDHSTTSKRKALYTIGKYNMAGLIDEVCQCLGNPSLEPDAEHVLGTFGERSVLPLKRFYESNPENINAQKCTLRIMGTVMNNESNTFLFNALWSGSRELKETAAIVLESTGFMPGGSDREKMDQLISEVTGIIAWDTGARINLEKNRNAFLLGRISDDLARWQSYLFTLLSISYGRGHAETIRLLLDEGSETSLSLAAGVIDNLISPPVSQQVAASLTILSDKARLKKLRRWFPGEEMSYENLCEAVINRDYNLLDLWTKACTLRYMPEIRTPAMTESASALLFSPEEIMREESARLMARTNRELYWSVSERLADPLKRRLDTIVMGKLEQEDLVFNKVSFLAEHLKGIPERHLLSLSGNMVFAREYLGTPLHQDCIIWPVRSMGPRAYLHYSMQKDISENLPGSNEPCYFLSLSSLEEFSNHTPGYAAEITGYIRSIQQLKTFNK